MPDCLVLFALAPTVRTHHSETGFMTARFCSPDRRRRFAWRGLLAASLDAFPMEIESVDVRAAPGNAAGHLLGAWLSDRLGLPVRVDHGGVGRGINFVVLAGTEGEIRVERTDGNLAVYSAPGLPERLVALPRRDLNTLLTEELRRLDDDLIYAESMAALVRRLDEREHWEQKA